MTTLLLLAVSCRTIVTGTPDITTVDTGTWGPEVSAVQVGLDIEISMRAYPNTPVTLHRFDTAEDFKLTLDDFGVATWTPDLCLDLGKTLPLSVSLDGVHSWPFSVDYAGYEAKVSAATAVQVLWGPAVSCGRIVLGETHTIALSGSDTAVYAVSTDVPMTITIWSPDLPEEEPTVLYSQDGRTTSGFVALWDRPERYNIELTYGGFDPVDYIWQIYSTAVPE